MNFSQPMNETGSRHALRGLTSLALALGLGLGVASTASAQHQRTNIGDTVRIVVDADDALTDMQVKRLGASAGVALHLDSEFQDGPNVYTGLVPRDRVDDITAALQARHGVEFVEAELTMADDFVEIVVDARDSLSDAQVKAIGLRAGVKLALNSMHSDDANLYVGQVHVDQAERVMDAIAQSEGVEFVEPNVTMSAFGAPNDPLYQYQWHFNQINAESAWSKTAGRGVVVAVIDTGVAYKDKKDAGFTQTPDLKGTAFVPGYDFCDKDDEPLDEHGHGTHVAGTIAQTTNNGFGAAGVAYHSKIMPLRVLNKNGYGSVADIADSIRFAADNGAHVINMSLGGPLPSLTMRSAISYAHDKGVTVIAAAGNSGRRMKSYPAAYKHVVAVAATQYDRKTTFYSQYGNFVDIAAPGGNTRVDQNRDGRPDGVLQQTLKRGKTNEHEFALYMGTSMASPHVAAVAAMIIANGTTDPDRVEAILKDTANNDNKDKIDRYAERYGAGIMDANAATGQVVLGQGILRVILALFVLILILIGVSKQDALGAVSLKRGAIPLAIGLILASSGFFFLSALGCAGACPITIDLLSRPLAMLDLTLFGPDFHQNALLASALVPFAALAVGLNARTLKPLAVGLAVGFAGFLFAEVYLMTSDVQWIPGTAGLLDQAWLFANGLISATLAFLALKRY